MSKKICLVSTYCDSPNKISILNSNLEKIKELGLDILTYSPKISLDKETIKKSDFYFLSKENPIIEWPEYVHVNWIELDLPDKKIRLSRISRDHGWAGMYQLKKLLQIAGGYDYDVYYFLIYDIKISDEVKEIFLSNDINCFFPFDQGENGFSEISTNLIVLDKKNLLLLSNLINKKLYSDYFNIEKTLKKIKESMPEMEIKKSPIIYDQIDTYADWRNKHFNFSPVSDFKIYYEKDIINPESCLKIIAINNKDEENIFLSFDIDGTIIESEVKDYKIMETKLPLTHIKNIKISYCGESYDQTEVFNSFYGGRIEEIKK